MPRERGLERSLSWPPPRIQIATDTYKAGSNLTPSTDKHAQSDGIDQADLEEYPDRIFSSPVRMYEYEDWASDSDDDEEEVEWDAGITDFALFDYDRRQAEERNVQLPSRWDGVMQSQSAALDRSARRHLTTNTAPFHENWLRISAQDMPDLTPDQSPDLRDDLDDDSISNQNAMNLAIPHYFTREIAPSAKQKSLDSQADFGSFGHLALTSKHHEPSPTSSIQRPQRPGLKNSRTMSGHLHAWKRPGRKMYTVGEEPQAESAEDECEIRRVDSSTWSGWPRVRRYERAR